MRELRSNGRTPLSPAPAALAVGNFDGVHLGHRAVLASAVEAARSSGGEAWVLSFDPHPAAVLRPGAEPARLTSGTQRTRLFAELGMHGWWVLPFDESVAAL